MQRALSPFRGTECLPRPRALAGEAPIDLRMAAGDHGLLNIHPVDEQLADGSAVSVGCDAAKADRPSDHHSAEVIAGGDGCVDIHHRPGGAPPHFRGVDAGQPDLFALGRGARIAVVAVADGHGL